MSGIGMTQPSHQTVERFSLIPTVPRASEFGKPIPLNAQLECLELMVEEWGCPQIAADAVVRETAKLLERDLPDAALRTLFTLVDLTGAYRLVAMMAVATQ
jgi:hypothetical protein